MFLKVKKGAYIILAFQLQAEGFTFHTVCENDRISVYTWTKGRATKKLIVKK